MMIACEFYVLMCRCVGIRDLAMSLKHTTVQTTVHQELHHNSTIISTSLRARLMTSFSSLVSRSLKTFLFPRGFRAESASE